KSGCPSNTIPNRSNASRSNQFTVGQTLTNVGRTGKSSPATKVRTRMRQLFLIDSRWITTAERCGNQLGSYSNVGARQPELSIPHRPLHTSKPKSLLSRSAVQVSIHASVA